MLDKHQILTKYFIACYYFNEKLYAAYYVFT